MLLAIIMVIEFPILKKVIEKAECLIKSSSSFPPTPTEITTKDSHFFNKLLDK